MRGNLFNGRDPTQLTGEAFEHRVQLEVSLLHGTRGSNCPRAIAEMALQGAGDGRGRKRREGKATGRIEPLDRFHESKERDLSEIVHVFTAAGEAPRDRVGKVGVRLEEPVALPRISGALIIGEVRTRGPSRTNA